MITEFSPNKAISSFDSPELQKIFQNQFVILDIYLPNCNPCKILDESIKIVSKEYPSVHFLKVHQDLHLDLIMNIQNNRRQYIRSNPKMLFYKNGKFEKLVSGAKSPQELRKLLEIFVNNQ